MLVEGGVERGRGRGFSDTEVLEGKWVQWREVGRSREVVEEGNR